MNKPPRLLLVTPPLLQPNTPYPATPYLTGYLRREGHDVSQYDLSVELLGEVFSAPFLTELFGRYDGYEDENIRRIFRLRRGYIDTVDSVMQFLREEDSTIAHLICGADFLPQAGRFESIEDLDAAFGQTGLIDCAKYLSTLYLEDLSDFIRAVDSPLFEMVRYGEKIALSVPGFSSLAAELDKLATLTEQKMVDLLLRKVDSSSPDFIGFTLPFPGNLPAALRCARSIRERYPDVKIIAGGGYPSTELRSLNDAAVFDLFDYIVLDDGEKPLRQLLDGEAPVNTFWRRNGKVTFLPDEGQPVSHRERGRPDYSGLPMDRYFSVAATVNPMHRLWSDGKWIKLMAAHGCYWAKCAFCDTSLDYICRYDAVDAVTLVDWMEELIAETGRTGFHFVDEALPPALAKAMALELLRRGVRVTWWGNIRFEAAFTADVCQLLAASGCIAVSGGIEVASDRLLEKMNKGVSVEQLTMTLRNFFYAGIMVHTYLMYGFPTQTLQETVDSLEVIRQLFRAELIGSAFWHRYAMTIHSPTGQDPQKYGVSVKPKGLHPFANNEIYFREERNYSVERAGEALRRATYNFMRQAGLDKPVHRWFEGKTPETTIEPTLITDQLIKPDGSRLFDEGARLIWLGNPPERVGDELLITGKSKEKRMKFKPHETSFLLEIIGIAGDLRVKTDFTAVKTLWAEFSDEPFVVFYHSKKWDILRQYGLLQV